MTQPEIRYTRSEDGIRIAYQYIDGRDPIVFNPPLLGYQFERSEAIPAWRAYREALRGDNAWLILDYRGHGLSGTYQGSVSISDFALDVEAVAAEFPGREMVLVPSSSGLGPAVEFTLRHPERVRGLLLRGPSRAGFNPGLIAAMREDLEQGIFIAARFSYEWESDDLIWPLVRAWMKTLRVREFWEAHDAFAEWDLDSRLPLVQVPIILTGGITEEQEIHALGARLPAARIHVTEAPAVISRKYGALTRELIEPWLATSRSRSAGSDTAEFTPRQLEVLRLVASGQTNREIAEALGIASGTVARHVSDVLGRAGLRNRAEAARYAADRGLMDPSEGRRG